MKSERVLVLEIGERLIKVCGAVISKKEKKIEALEVFEFFEGPAFWEIEAVFLKFKKLKYEKIIILLSRSSFLIKYMELPSSDLLEARKMLPFQLKKKAFYLPEDAAYDYSIVQTKKNYSKALIFIIQQKRIANILELIKKYKITPKVMTINSWGLLNRFISREEVWEGKTASFFILVDIDKDMAQFLAVDRQGLVFSRAFSHQNEEDILKGVNQSAGIFKEEFPNIEFKKMIFTGLKKEAVFKSIKGVEAVFADSLDSFVLTRGVRSGKELDDFSFAACLGVCCIKNSPKFDFLPEFLKKKKADKKRRKKYLKAFFIAAEIVLLFSIFTFKYISDRYLCLNYLNSALEEISAEAKELEGLSNKLKILKEEPGDRAYFSEAVYNLIMSLPQGAQLTFTDFKDNGEFAIKGYAQNNTQVFSIKSSLNSSGSLKDVQIKYAAKIKQDDETLVEFYIYGKIRGSGPIVRPQ
ncbi:MAG: hypothetical protein ABIH08_03305 [Candidatus Omnitrophota bacterium]